MSEKKEADVRFKKFGTVSFTALTKVNDFITYLEEGKLMGTRCRVCGMVFFPPRADCYGCLSSDMEWFQVTGTGKLLTWSRLQYGPVGFEGDLPYSIAVLDYGAYKVFGRIAGDVPEEELSVGMEMKAEANTLSNGQINYVFSKA
jgi:uncharacterized OB-fold protein